MQQLPDLTLRQLHYLVTAADSGKMSDAGALAHVSQSAISLAISEIERHLDVQIFIRDRRRGLIQTTAGAAIVAAARELLRSAVEFEAGARGADGSLRGTIRIGCYDTLAPFVLPGVLSSFGRAFPEIDVQFVEGRIGDLTVALRAGEIEAMIVYDYELDSDLTTSHLQQTTPVAILPHSHALAGKKKVTLKQLAREPYVLLTQPQPQKYFVDLLEAAGVNADVTYRTGSFEMVRSLVGRGLGVSMLIQRPVGDHTYEGLPIAVRPIHRPPIRQSVVMARLAKVRLSANLSAFLEHAKVAMSDPPRHLNQDVWQGL